MLFRNDLVADLCFCESLCSFFEFLRKVYIVEEGPRIVELVVPCPFEVLHGLNDAL